MLLALLAACARQPRPDSTPGDDTGPAGDTAEDTAPDDTAPPEDTGPADADGDGYVAADDCDDTRAAVHPGASEVCDGLDDDCDGGVDGDAAWWPGAGDVRVPVDVVAPEGGLGGDLVAIPVDLGALGLDPALFATASVVLPGCDLADPRLPTQAEDGLSGLLEARDASDPLGDGVGDVLFAWDEDADAATGEALGADETGRVWLYFGGEPGTATSGVEASSQRLANTRVAATFSAGDGGLLSSLTLDGGAVVADQADAGGNGAYIGDWSSTATSGEGVVDVLADGPVVGVVAARGTRSGVAWDVWYVLGARPELRVKARFTADADVVLDHPGDWSNGVRPFQSRHDALEPAVGTVDPDRLYVDASGAGTGVTVAWITPPAWLPYAPEVYDGNLIVFGNDLSDATGGTLAVAAGTDLVSNRTLALVPHGPDTAGTIATLPSVIAGLTATVGQAETRD